MSNNTGGSAFPGLKLTSSHGSMSSALGSEYTPIGGMTLRDYFAAKAMQGLLASEVHAPLEDFAATAYKMANEMLKAREA